MTPAVYPVIQDACLSTGLANTLPAQAGYGFALAISPEIRLQPGSHVHLPARHTNTGTLDIAFGPGSGAFNGQFNDLTLRPGEHIDFAYLNIHADADAPLGAISHQYPLLGIAFPDGANLMAAGYTQPAHPVMPYPWRGEGRVGVTQRFDKAPPRISTRPAAPSPWSEEDRPGQATTSILNLGTGIHGRQSNQRNGAVP